MRVIINADDFGLNATVNREIERCIHEGLITSTTIMAAGEGFDEAVKISKRYPQISFGVHLTLDELSSLTKSPILQKYGMTDDHGVFIKGGLFRVAKWTSELTTAISLELEAQVERIIAAGIMPSHFDGHHHCHTIPALHPILMDLTEKYHIKSVRVPLDSRTIGMMIHHVTPAVQMHNSEPSGNSSISSNNVNIIKKISHIIDSYKNNRFFKKHFKTTDYCCSVATFMKNSDFFLGAMRDKTCELMCHPGHSIYIKETAMLRELPILIERTSYLEL